MPWKIRNAEFTGKNPCLHLEDQTVDLHLVTDLGTGVVDLFIGALNPDEANIHVSFDVERSPVVLVQRIAQPGKIQVTIIDSVLMTMGIKGPARGYLLQEARRVAHRMAEAEGMGERR